MKWERLMYLLILYMSCFAVHLKRLAVSVLFHPGSLTLIELNWSRDKKQAKRNKKRKRKQEKPNESNAVAVDKESEKERKKDESVWGCDRGWEMRVNSKVKEKIGEGGECMRDGENRRWWRGEGVCFHGDCGSFFFWPVLLEDLFFVLNSMFYPANYPDQCFLSPLLSVQHS